MHNKINEPKIEGLEISGKKINDIQKYPNPNLTKYWGASITDYIPDRTSFIPETNKHQTQKKNECTHTLKHTRTEQYISAASNAFSHAYIAFQHTLSYSIRDKQPKM
jgi:hypothetical protein